VGDGGRWRWEWEWRMRVRGGICEDVKGKKYVDYEMPRMK
jgi:hypothetical protein